MYRTTINFHDRISRGEIPVPYILIHTDMGYRAYAEKELKGVFEAGDRNIFDGSWDLDGSVNLGSDGLGLLEKSARVLSFGNFERTIQPKTKDVLVAFWSKQLQHISVTLENSDRYFGKLIAKEPLLSKELAFFVGFEDIPQSEHLQLFKGIIMELKIDPSSMILEAEES